MNPKSLPLLTIFLISSISSFTVPSSSASDRTTNLVFKGCANQNFPQDAPYGEALQNLLEALITQSESTKFSNATSSPPTAQPVAINGLFQCRGDLSASSCRGCVEKAKTLIPKLCGGGSIAARIQLNGCYLSYALSNFKQPGDEDEIYKVCDSDRVSGSGFGDRLGVALNEVVKGVGSGNSGFYAGEYQDVYVMGQCEGGLGGGECVNCVKSAVGRVVAECGGAVSGQVYLEKCYVSYKYYPRGVNMGQENSLSSSGSGKNTQKIIALVLGGVLGVGLVMACLLFTKSALKKKTHTYKYGG